jgi:hypothetical protein
MKTTDSFGPTRIAIQSFAILAFVVANVLSHDVVVRVFAAAILLTITFCLQPSLFRDRAGSLVPMIVMLTLAWLSAMGILVCSIFGR